MSLRPSFQTEVEFTLPRAISMRPACWHRRVSAASHGGRRDPAAARSARAAERGLSGDHRLARVITAWATCPASTPAS